MEGEEKKEGERDMTLTLALGWALVDSLWQDALAAAGLAALFALIPVRAARLRYALATLALLVMLAFPLATAVRLTHQDPWTWVYETAPAVAPASAPTTAAASPAPAPRSAVTTGAQSVGERIRASLEPMLPWLVLVWLGGVVALSLRLASGWLLTRRMRSVGTSPVPEACVEAVTRLARRLRVSSPVRVLQSALVHVPAVVGGLRPVILLPASVLTGLTPLQLDALLAHELAHIRRYDYLVNLAQSVIETLLFYHPAVWWVSRSIREEREHCCDDLAVRVCGDAHFYATALLGMERLRISGPTLAMAATGAGSLVARVRRLVSPTQTEFPRWMAGVVAVSLALAGAAHLASGTIARDNGMTPPPYDRMARVEAVVDPDARREVVKHIGRTGDARALATLLSIARTDVDEDVQREAIEALGRLNDGAGIDAVVELARTHPNGAVRREAVRVVREVVPPSAAIGLLDTIAVRDSDERVQREAAAELGHLRTTATLPSLARLARTHPNAVVREEALEQYAKRAVPESALVLLNERLVNDPATNVQTEAVERLAELPDDLGVPTLTRAVRTHPNPEVRAEARRRLP
jgi:beta-lactamase regulating signal transducer with metallopeptidase domain